MKKSDEERFNWSIIVEVVFEDMEPFVEEVRKILFEITSTR